MDKRRGLLWSLLISFLSAIAVSIAGVIYTGVSNDDRDRQWCELLTTLDSAYSSEPPRTELGKKVAEAINKLNRNFGC